VFFFSVDFKSAFSNMKNPGFIYIIFFCFIISLSFESNVMEKLAEAKNLSQDLQKVQEAINIYQSLISEGNNSQAMYELGVIYKVFFSSSSSSSFSSFVVKLKPFFFF